MVEFRNIPTILTGDELIDKAFKKASRVTVMHHEPFMRVKQTEVGRVRSVENTLNDQLDRWVRAFPTLDNLPAFYLELLGVIANVEKMKRSLGALSWARKRIVEVAEEAVPALKKARNEDEVIAARKAAYGRIASLIKQINKDLVYLNLVRESMRALPEVATDIPTIVVAGYPNVGKSSFVAKVSTVQPEIAPYPFTTKGIVIGHVDVPRGRHATDRFQIVDTPGLLDRDLAERNAIELQAILALKHLAHAVVFLVDPSEFCGYPLDAQERLLADVRANFAGIPIVVAESKADIEGSRARGKPDRLAVSAVTGEGIDALKQAAVEAARAKHKEAVAARKEAASASPTTGGDKARVNAPAAKDAGPREPERAEPPARGP